MRHRSYATLPNKQEANGKQTCVWLPPLERSEMHDEEDEDLDEGECVLCDMRGFLVICELCNQDYCLDCSGLQNQHNVPDGPWYCNQCRPGSSTQHRRRGSASASGNGRGWASAPRGRGAGEGALGGAHEVRRDSRERRSAGSRAGGSHEQLEHGTRQTHTYETRVYVCALADPR
jgi:hypothetical protein